MSSINKLTPETHISEAGRQQMAAQLAIVLENFPNLINDTDPVAVHETRKAIRRTFTAYKTFANYFDEDVLTFYQKRLKKIMRRLGRSRDLTVFLNNYETFRQEQGGSHADYDSLASYWQDQLLAANTALRVFLDRPKATSFLEDYDSFTWTPGSGTLIHSDKEKLPFTPIQIRHVAPLLVHERLAAVLAFDDYLAGADFYQLHRLRVQFKELRYTLEFFVPLLSVDVAPLLDHLNTIQDHLGNLNDAHVAQKLLGKTPGRQTAVTAYRTHCRETAAALEATFPEKWAAFNDPQWQQQLLTAVLTI